jgi:hypothetical protein
MERRGKRFQAIFPPLFLLWRLSSHAQRYKKGLFAYFKH